ncbi:nicotinate-nucleotide adenylyltransferase [Megamonas hypermegale]|uniref:Probable nicotinate-nucleotide adenylyltransferase n=1 Tax=Megamonas hypermegale TaxID=158847 RepID=A0A921HQ81_9FIRM|nr:nicotinate-nucleotide adenylyltransferase [Megamonas hypermegale]MDM8142191.1 nicotinate-nucleotide adenylyltransferase [Megamonas hypermegale]HJF85623.1 nicotinate-nucleotide adenylyltransferase [Megamonas hypermegale]
MKKIGIMGGTFDPIHVGHLMIAEAVWDEYKLEKVLFIPSANPPHKHDVMTSARHRFNMTLLATCSNPHFEVSSIEMDRTGPSYTIDTIKALKKIYGDDTDFYFIIGADCIHELPSWHKIDELLKICKFIATKRPSYKLDLSIIAKEFSDYNIQLLETPELEISSTDIRQRIKKGYSIQYITTEQVQQYIRKEELYL